MSQDSSNSRHSSHRPGLVPVVVVVVFTAVAVGLLSTVDFQPSLRGTRLVRGGAEALPVAAVAAPYRIEPVADTSVPDAAAVFRGRNMPEEELAPTF